MQAALERNVVVGRELQTTPGEAQMPGMPGQWHPLDAHAGAGMLTVVAAVGADDFPGCHHK